MSKKTIEPTSVVVIPARMASSRFPNKPLADIMGKSLINRVYDIAESSDVDAVIVATDHEDIFNHVLAFGGNAVMTSSTCMNGTERIHEAIHKLSDLGEDFDIVINVQGDEPTLAPVDINKLIQALKDSESDVATLIYPIETIEEIQSQHVVKVVCTVEDELGLRDALYFSRSPIPAIRADVDRRDIDYYKHLGVYAFTAESLSDIEGLDATDLEEAESLEQLRWLQNHMVISVVEAERSSIGVDIPEDIAAVENFLKSSI